MADSRRLEDMSQLCRDFPELSATTVSNIYTFFGRNYNSTVNYLHSLRAVCAGVNVDQRFVETSHFNNNNNITYSNRPSPITNGNYHTNIVYNYYANVPKVKTTETNQRTNNNSRRRGVTVKAAAQMRLYELLTDAGTLEIYYTDRTNSTLKIDFEHLHSVVCKIKRQQRKLKKDAEQCSLTEYKYKVTGKPADKIGVVLMRNKSTRTYSCRLL